MAESEDRFPHFAETNSFATGPASRIPRRPLLGVALLFLSGTGAGLYLPVPFWIPLAGSLLGLLGCWRSRRVSLASACLFAALFSGGWSAATFSVNPPGRTSLPRLLQRPAEALTVRGIIVDDPVLVSAGSSDEDECWTFLINAERVNRMGTSTRTYGRIRCRWTAPASRPACGQYWQFHGVLRDHQRLDPESFRRHRMSLTLHGPGHQLLEEDAGNPVVAMCYRARRGASRILERGLGDQPEVAGLLQALMLGYRSELSPDLKETFEVTGTLHIFAISGLHVGVFGSLVVVLLRILGIPRYRWSLLLAPILLAYVVGTGMKPSALRACVMALAFWAGPTFARKPDAPSALALAALLIVGVHPPELKSPGFILSFSVVTGILLLYPLFVEALRGRLRPDPWRRDPEAAVPRLTRRLATTVGSLLALSLACWLVSFPLTAQLFSRFSPVGLLGNLVVVPGAFLVVLTGCLSLVSGLFSDLLAEIFNHANAVFIRCLLESVDRLSSIPFGHRWVPPPGLVLILGWYGMLIGWRMLPPSQRRRSAVLMPIAIAAWLLAIPLLGAAPWATVLAADGASTLTLEAGRDTVLVGVEDVRQAEEWIDTFNRRGRDRIRVLVLDRGTPDALEAAEQCLSELRVGEIWLTSMLAPEASVRLRAHGVPLRRLQVGEVGFLEDGTEWEVLALPYPDFGGPVIRFARDQDAIIYMSDPDASVQHALTRSALEPSATVLVLSDPRGPPPLLPTWVEDTGAVRIIASRKRRLDRGDDYPAWRRALEGLAVTVELLQDGESRDPTLPADGESLKPGT